MAPIISGAGDFSSERLKPLGDPRVLRSRLTRSISGALARSLPAERARRRQRGAEAPAAGGAKPARCGTTPRMARGQASDGATEDAARRSATSIANGSVSYSSSAMGTSVAVGTTLAFRFGPPPHRSQRAGLPHWALALGRDREAFVGPGMNDVDRGEPAINGPTHSVPGDRPTLASPPERAIPVLGYPGLNASSALMLVGTP